ncbi:hypothetical protein SAMN05660816_03075 [Niastella yeongjuensis]|nr:hypothetical protein SAMN05660816_03075 [Niastella yeongjuensis]
MLYKCVFVSTVQKQMSPDDCRDSFVVKNHWINIELFQPPEFYFSFGITSVCDRVINKCYIFNFCTTIL